MQLVSSFVHLTDDNISGFFTFLFSFKLKFIMCNIFWPTKISLLLFLSLWIILTNKICNERQNSQLSLKKIAAETTLLLEDCRLLRVYECLSHISTCGANAFSFLLWLSAENEVLEETKQSFHKGFSHSFPDQKKNHSHTRQRRSTGNQHKLTLCVDYLIISIKSYKTLKYVLQFPLHNPVLMIYLSVHPQW